VQQAPTFISPSAVSVPENFTDVVYRPVATDAQNDPLTYGAIGGPDAALFTTSPVTREVRFTLPPNYEQPGDVGGNNVYDISFTASDGANTTTQNVAVTVADVRSGYNVRRIPWDSLTSLLAGYPDGSGRIVMLRHTGTLALVNIATGSFTSMAELASTPYFDSPVSGVITVYDIAFSPGFIADRTFYIALYRQDQGIEVVKFRMSATTADQVDLASADVIFRAPIAGTQVDGVGFMEFDSLGRLYIGMRQRFRYAGKSRAGSGQHLWQDHADRSLNRCLSRRSRQGLRDSLGQPVCIRRRPAGGLRDGSRPSATCPLRSRDPEHRLFGSGCVLHRRHDRLVSGTEPPGNISNASAEFRLATHGRHNAKDCRRALSWPRSPRRPV
jgi:hypothetical protein